MIKTIPGLPEGTIGVAFSGVVTEEDYTGTLLPAIEMALQETDRVRLLVVVDADFSDFTLGAAKEDAKLGMAHWSGFDRIAVVSPPGWVTGTVRALSVMMPCPVMVFAPEEVDDAKRWLSESLGSIHQTDLGDGVLHVALLGQLDAEIYAEETEDLNAFIRANDRFRLLLDLRHFDGWQGLGALSEHYRLVRDHHMLIDKLAIVGNRAWERLAAKIGARALNADSRYFDEDEFAQAKDWVSS
ncbi:MAG: STAS/SEC14 domain-containing protein [Pseudomonadota bacterium]